MQTVTGCSIGVSTPRGVSPALGWRALLAAMLFPLLLVAVLLSMSGAGGSSELARTGRGSSSRERPSVLPSAALAPVSAALGRSDPAYRVTPSGGGFDAKNPAQRLDLRFGRSGLQLTSGGVRLGLSLRAAGYGTSLRAVGDTMPRASGNRVLYARAGLEEWYVNGPLGLEQGFTLTRAPSSAPAGTLTLAVALSGDTHASFDPTRQIISLTGPSGASLRYSALLATDSRGHALHSWLKLKGRTILLQVDTRGARYPLRIDPLIQQLTKLTATGEGEDARFGYNVALSADGTMALVGDRHSSEAGWVFVRTGSTWAQQGSPLAISEESPGGECDEEPGECGGRPVALSADGNTALIGAPNEDGTRGAVWVFTRSGTGWEQQGEKLTGGEEEIGNGHFGRSVALSADGDTALIGAPANHEHRGAAWIFTRSGGTWVQQGTDLTGGEASGESRWGRSVALSADGNTALIGAPNEDGTRGAVWVFTRSGTGWEQQGEKLTGGEEEIGNGYFGTSVALSAFGNTALIGARSDNGGLGAAWVFTRSGASWEQQGAKLTGGAEEDGAGEFGYGVALSADGEVALIGARKDDLSIGAAWLFTRSGVAWGQQGAKLTSSEEGRTERFGTGVALSSSGASFLIGAPLNKRTGAAWTYTGEYVPPPSVLGVDPGFGSSVGGTRVVVRGSGFVEGASVEFGGVVAGSVDVVSESELTAVTPAHAVGPVEVVVADGDGVSMGGATFTYVPPPLPPVVVGGSGLIGSSGVLSSQVGMLPAPTLGTTGNLAPVSGKVLVKLPGSAGFVVLTGIREVPFGTIINAINGEVTVTTVGPNGADQVMSFYAGDFELTQNRHGVVLAKLVGGNFSVCPTTRERRRLARASSSRASAKHVVRKLWAGGHGSYTTRGSYASGAVLGTRWLTEDLCDGTFIYVATDRVEVTNLVTHRRLIVKAGHSYLAKAP